jgi:murein L,D-transpeptidase YafK
MFARPKLSFALRVLLVSALGLIASPVSVADRFTLSGALSPLARPEPILSQVFGDIELLRPDRALERLEALLQVFPNFRLAHLVKGDLLLARARPLSTFGDVEHAPADRIAELREEAIARVKAFRDKPPANALPRALLQLQPEQKNALVIDTLRSRLYVFENDRGRPHYVADYYITQGKAGADKMQQGDRKTPVGVYFVTDSLPREKLTDFYGSGAFPINYPNEWDRRMGRNGYGIWLHGTPSDTFSRPPRASDGCVVLANTDLDEVAQRLQVGVTPVIIGNGIEWANPGQWEAERRQLSQQVESWQRDLGSGEVDRYLSHYSMRFSSERMNFAQWSRSTREAMVRNRTPAETRNLAIFRNPGKEPMAVVTFEQDTHGNGRPGPVKKRQYWIVEEGRWKIIYEGVA